jgi:hypothetical protein
MKWGTRDALRHLAERPPRRRPGCRRRGGDGDWRTGRRRCPAGRSTAPRRRGTRGRRRRRSSALGARNRAGLRRSLLPRRRGLRGGGGAELGEQARPSADRRRDSRTRQEKEKRTGRTVDGAAGVELWRLRFLWGEVPYCQVLGGLAGWAAGVVLGGLSLRVCRGPSGPPCSSATDGASTKNQSITYKQ